VHQRKHVLATKERLVSTAAGSDAELPARDHRADAGGASEPIIAATTSIGTSSGAFVTIWTFTGSLIVHLTPPKWWA